MTAPTLRPLCRWCGKIIAIHTTTLVFREAPTQYDHPTEWCSYSYGPKPKNREEAQKRTNQAIVKVEREKDTKYVDGEARVTETGFIARATIWDRSTYRDPYFCRDRCAVYFAGMMAREYPTVGTSDWVIARDRQRKAAAA